MQPVILPPLKQLSLTLLAVALMLGMQACGIATEDQAHNTLAPAIASTPTAEPSPPPAPAGRQGLGGWPFQSRSPWDIPISKTAAYESLSTPCSSSFHNPSGGSAYLSAATWTTAICYARYGSLANDHL